MTPLHSLETVRARPVTARVMLAGAFIICLCGALDGLAQVPTPLSCPTPPPTAVGVIRLLVRDSKNKPVPRQRFFIFNQNSLLEGADLAKLIPELINNDATAGKAPLTRDAFYQSLRLNDQDSLLRWLRNEKCKPDSFHWCECDSVYCRQIEE